MGRFDALTQISNKPPTPAPAATGQSAHVLRSATPPPSSSQEQRPLAPEPSNARIGERANARTMERSNGRRIITRNSFEIYEDQMDSLRKLAAREIETKGKLGSMSAMVREAIDTFIQKKSSEK